MFEND